MKLLTPENVADVLAVSRSTILRLIQDGSLPAVCLKRGARKAVYRIREEQLNKWIISRETRKVTTKDSPLPATTTGAHPTDGQVPTTD